MKKMIFALLGITCFGVTKAEAAYKILDVRCQREVLPSVEASPTVREETISVCEATVQAGGEKANVIIRNFEGGFRPELTFVKKDQAPAISLIRARGELRVAPTNFSLLEKSGKKVFGVDLENNFRAFWQANQNEITGYLGNALASYSQVLSAQEANPLVDLVTPGRYTFSATRNRVPFAAYYWPQEDSPIANGPLAKYDTFVTSQGGQAGAVNWERSRHNHTDYWAGHCNGWAAGSVLYAEPRASVRTPNGSQTFQISDLKALIVEASYCVDYLFFGRRYFGGSDDPLDIQPALFHQVLVNYLRDQGKPIAVDIKPQEEVYNHVISGVNMEIRTINANTVNVRAVAKVHYYESYNSEKVGESPSVNVLYEYTLSVRNGQIVGNGTWVSENPDFLWVPLAPRDCGGNRENAYVTSSWVERILNLGRTNNE